MASVGLQLLFLSGVANGHGFQREPALHLNRNGEDAVGIVVSGTNSSGAVAAYLGGSTLSPYEAFVLVRRTTDGGRSWGEPVELSPFEHRNDVGSPKVSTFSAGGVVVAWTGAGDRAYVSVSHNEGESWLESPVSLFRAFAYDLATDGESLACVAATDHDLNIVAAVTTDAGSSWISSETPIESAPGYPETISVLTPGNGRVFILSRMLSDIGAGEPEEGEGLYLLVSIDNGQNWSRPRRIDEMDERYVTGKMVADNSDDVLVVWTESIAPGYAGNVLSRRVSGNGLVLEPIVPVNSTALGRVRNIDVVSTQGDGVVVMYSADTDSRSADSLFAIISSDGGRSFGWESVRVSHDSGASGALAAASLASGCDGLVVAHWLRRGRSDNRAWVRANVSRNGGATWLPRDVRLDGEIGERQVVLQESTSAALLSGGSVIFPWDETPQFGGQDAYVAVAVPNVLVHAGESATEIPASGGTVTMDFLVENDFTTTYEGVSAWVDMRLPDGSTTEPLLGPVTLARLEPGRSIRGTRPFAIAGSWPAGRYALNLRLGPPVNRVGSLCFTKLP